MGINLKYGTNSSAAKCQTSMPGNSAPPSKAGQSSGEVTHGRSGSKVENLKDTPKKGAAH